MFEDYTEKKIMTIEKSGKGRLGVLKFFSTKVGDLQICFVILHLVIR